MSKERLPASPPPATLTVKIGRALEAHATGWGVAAVPLVLLLLLAAGVAGLLLNTG